MKNMKVYCFAVLSALILSAPMVSFADESGEKDPSEGKSRVYGGFRTSNLRKGVAEAGFHADFTGHGMNRWEYSSDEAYHKMTNRYVVDGSIGVATDGVLSESTQGQTLVGNFGANIEMMAHEDVAPVGGNSSMIRANQSTLDIDPYAIGGAFIGMFSGAGALPNGVRVRHNVGETTVRAIPIGITVSRRNDDRMNYYTGLQLERDQKLVGGLDLHLRGKAALTYKGSDAGSKQLNGGVFAQAEGAVRYTASNGIYGELNASVSNNIMKVVDSDESIRTVDELELQGGFAAGKAF